MCDDFKQSFINLNTRKFGRATEIIIGIIYDLNISDNLEYDLSKNDLKIEIKSSRVYKKNTLTFDKDTIYQTIISHDYRNTLLKQSDIQDDISFDCNIQQIKIKLFDFMYYVLFFYDVIEVFKITNKDITNDMEINYSNKQHRGNENEGQFHVNNRTYKHHKKTYFLKSYTYKELVSFIKKKEK